MYLKPVTYLCNLWIWSHLPALGAGLVHLISRKVTPIKPCPVVKLHLCLAIRLSPDRFGDLMEEVLLGPSLDLRDELTSHLSNKQAIVY